MTLNQLMQVCGHGLWYEPDEEDLRYEHGYSCKHPDNQCDGHYGQCTSFNCPIATSDPDDADLAADGDLMEGDVEMEVAA